MLSSPTYTNHEFYAILSILGAGGADLGARPPAAGSLHRAGCEDGRAGRRQDPRSLLLTDSTFLSPTLSRGGAEVPSTARVGRALSHRARSASKEGTQPHPPNFFFSISFTFPGFAFPPLAFITCPTRNPSTCCFPSLNCATCAGFFARTSSIVLSSAPSSDT